MEIKDIAPSTSVRDSTRPTRPARLFTARMLPPLYWRLIHKGAGWLAEPQALPAYPGTAPMAVSIKRRI